MESPMEQRIGHDIICPHCGKQNESDALECRYCGIVFAKYRNRPAVRPSQPSEPQLLADLSLRQLKQWGRFFGNLANLVGAGIPLQQAWNQAVGQGSVRRELAEPVAPHLVEGRSLADAIRRARIGLPNDAWGHLEAGRLTGRLDLSLKRIAAAMERRYRSALAVFLNPATLYFLAILVFAGGSLGVMGAVTSQTSEITEATRGEIVSGIVRRAVPRVAGWWFLVAILVTLVVLFLRRWEPALMRRFPAWERVRLSHGLFGPMVRDPWLAVYARQLAEFLDAGLPLGKALDFSAMGLPFPMLSHQLASVRESTERGLGLAEAYAGIADLPADWVPAIATGVRAGSLVDNLNQLADRLEEGAANRRRVWRIIALSGITLLGAIIVLSVLVFGLSSYLEWYEKVLIESF